MLNSNLVEKLTDLIARQEALGKYFDVTRKAERLQEVVRELEDPEVWQDPKKAQDLGRERASLAHVVESLMALKSRSLDATELLNLATLEKDEALLTEISQEILAIEASVEKLEFQRMFSGKMDHNNAYLDIQSGSGGTEAQDWAEMLLRMFLRFGDKMGFKTELLENSSDGICHKIFGAIKL